MAEVQRAVIARGLTSRRGEATEWRLSAKEITDNYSGGGRADPGQPAYTRPAGEH